MGAGEATAREYISENYKEDMSFTEIINLAFNAIKETIDDELNKDLMRLSYIKSEDKKFKLCKKDEIDKYLKDLK